MTPVGGTETLLREARPETAPGTLPQPSSSIVSTRWQRRDWTRRRLLAGVDASAVLGALVLASVLTHPGHLTGRLALGALLIPAWILLFKSYGLYDRDLKRISHTTLDDVPGLFHAVIIGSLLMWLAFRAAPVVQLAFEEILSFGILALTFVVVARVSVRMAVRRRGCEQVLLMGAPEGTRLLSRKLMDHPEYGLRAVGVLSCGLAVNGDEHGHHRYGLPLLGGLDRLEDVIREREIGRLIVWSKCLEADDLVVLLRRCHALGLKVSVVPEMFDVMGPSVEVDEVEGMTVLGMNPPVLSRSSRYMKRAMDIAGATVALILFTPLLITVAIAVRLDSRGPIFFRQTRMGRGGRTFSLVKFRTMVVDAEVQREALLAQSDDPDWLKLDHDPRITRVGRLLRQTSLDELPQFWNVLVGHMSLVGPRPLIESEDRMVEGWGRARLDLTPGITGLWQVLGRTNIPFKEMVKLDYLYVTNWTLWTDVRLMFRTLPAVLMRRGVN